MLFRNRLVIPAKTSLKTDLLKEFHDSPIGGNAGVKKTYQRAAAELYRPGMSNDISEYVRNCAVCQQNKTLTTTLAGLLQAIPLPTQTWEEITMDFIEGLSKSEGRDVIWVVVDRLSKYAHFIPLKHHFSAATIANSFIKEIVRLHGFLLPSLVIATEYF